ncbi:MAG: 2-phospho-L-lactate transferase [Pseudomonadales bacterium]|nr:2-phospho-L-lactate transferase [Pseudomonadales bacterium]
MVTSIFPESASCLAISGGVGGAKLALGLAHSLTSEQLNIVVNTGDDFEHLGMTICPDIDTLIYTLAELSNKEQGWGQANESWNFLAALKKLGGPDWFQLGDRDLATHIMRSNLLKEGWTLSEVTAYFCSLLGVEQLVVPMSDTKVSTQVHIKNGATLSFQHYFVRDRCAPVITGFDFKGIEKAQPSEGFYQALDDKSLACILICPSNPFVSVDPVLKLPGVDMLLQAAAAPVVAVSPIVNGIALKGPAAKMMQELGMPNTVLAVAEHYQGRIDGFVIDRSDAEWKPAIEDLGIRTLVTGSVMVTLQDRIDLAEACLQFAMEIRV